MGMYTEIFFRAELDDYAFGILKTMIDSNDLQELSGAIADDHEFFKKGRARQITSDAMAGAGHAVAQGDAWSKWVSLRSEIKNYDGEIEAFFDWVTPHVVTYGEKTFIGYSLYEEEIEPTLYYVGEGN